MIDVRHAVMASQQYMKSLSDLMPGGNLRREETEYDDESKRWLITVSYVPGPYGDILLGSASRIYKRLVVDAADGNVLAMKNR